MSVMETLIKAINDALQAESHTITSLARDCGCSRQHIYQILSGEQQPTLTLAEKILNAIGAEFTIKTRKAKKISA